MLQNLDPRVFDALMREITQKSKKSLYQRDFIAWQADVLGERTYEKMQEIGQDALFSPIPRTFVKSANGTSKTYQAARWAMWWVTCFPPEESLAIITAPTLTQVEQGIFHYLKTSYGMVKGAALQRNEPMPWPGWISEQGAWQYRTPGGNISLALARVPSPTDAVSTFQGIRREGGRSLILLDEAGGVSEAIFTAIEALITSDEARMVGIGNPDKRGTEFYNKFTAEAEKGEANLHTISAYDLPGMTGEIVYPDNPEKQALMLKGLTTAKWVGHKERVWMTGGELYYDEKLDLMRRAGGTPNGRFRSKVLGEFPGDADNSFFSEDHINLARETIIIPGDEQRPTLGVDIATTGEDESVVYVNRGGQLRVFDKTIPYMDGDEQRETSGVWSKEDTLSNARRIHAIAQYVNAAEVRIDGNAVGSGVVTDLMRLEEFSNRCYGVPIRIVSSKSSSDIARWRIWRDEIHDHFADQMRDGRLDLDPNDTQLRDELMLITYSLINGAIKIDKKSDMKTVMGGSPDRADAAMYAVLDTAALVDNPLGDLKPGDKVGVDPYEMLEEEMVLSGMPW
jgi:hypothetical protein